MVIIRAFLEKELAVTPQVNLVKYKEEGMMSEGENLLTADFKQPMISLRVE